QNSKNVIDNDVLIVLTPHVIRFPSITAENLRTMAAGTDSDVRVYHDSDQQVNTSPLGSAPAQGMSPGQAMPPQGGAMPGQQPAPGMPPSGAPAMAPAAQLHFDPPNVSLKAGDTTTLGLAISNVKDLYLIPVLIHYDPAVVQVEEIRDGGFLSGGKQEIAIVQRIDAQKGEAVISATRQPN